MIVLNPITLPASKFITDMTTLIGEVRFSNNLVTTEIVDNLVNSCRYGQVDYGKGIVNNFKVALQPVKDLTETSSAFTITKPNWAQETILIDSYKFVPISISSILDKDAFLNGSSVSTFASYVMSLMQDTAQFYLFDLCNAMYQNWTPGQATQTIKVKQLDTTNLTGADLTAALTWNSNELAKVMRKTVNNMKILNTKFTDATTYTDQNTGETGTVVSCVSGKDLKLVINDKYWTDFLAQSMASLYHSEKIGEMIPAENFVLLPEDAMKPGNENVIGWLSDKSKFALADFYRTTMSIRDPSTTYENSFYHFAYGTGVFAHAVGVKFVAEIIEGD